MGKPVLSSYPRGRGGGGGGQWFRRDKERTEAGTQHTGKSVTLELRKKNNGKRQWRSENREKEQEMWRAEDTKVVSKEKNINST